MDSKSEDIIEIADDETEQGAIHCKLFKLLSSQEAKGYIESTRTYQEVTFSIVQNDQAKAARITTQ